MIGILSALGIILDLLLAELFRFLECTLAYFWLQSKTEHKNSVRFSHWSKQKWQKS